MFSSTTSGRSRASRRPARADRRRTRWFRTRWDRFRAGNIRVRAARSFAGETGSETNPRQAELTLQFPAMRLQCTVIFSCVLVASLSVATAGSGPAPAKAAVPTFSKDVAPILYKNCTACHRPGEIAPMSLLTYEDARPWAKAIREKVVEKQMPPWHADPKHGEWLNDRRISQEAIDTIAKWVDGGAREGDPKDLPP